MKFLIDESLPPALCKWLIAQGHEADHVLRLKLGGRPDQDVLARAHRTGATIITKDRDYAEPSPTFAAVTVVWLRFGNRVNRELIAELDRHWADIMAALDRGEALVQVTEAAPP